MTSELRLAGAIAIRDRAGVLHPLPSGRAQIALARLALERENGTSRHELADSLWPDLLPPTWESALRSVVSRVRAFIAGTVPDHPSPVTVRSGRYVLTLPGDMVVDVEEGQAALQLARRALGAGRHDDAAAHASRAARLLRAPLLASHEGGWVSRARERFSDLHIDALETASAAATSLGHHGEAVTFANEAADLAPLRESAHRCRIIAHAAAGNRAAALRAYHDVRKTLVGELGVEPSSETDAVYLDVLSAGSTQHPAADDGATNDGHACPRAGTLPFVGRHGELRTIDACRARAGAGAAHLVVIQGELGAGKTRLAGEAARWAAASGAMVLGARCDGAASTPCAPFHEIVEGYVAATPDDLLPRIAGLRWTPGTSGGALQELARLRTAPPLVARAACVDLLRAAARTRPLYLALDDLHLADEHSLWMLRHLIGRATALPVLIVATVRTDTPPRQALRDILADLEREGRSTCIDLGGLDAAAVRELRRHAPPLNRRRSTARLLAATGGNPFLLCELLSQAPEPNGDPAALPAVMRYAQSRLAALGGHEVALAEVAAVAGPTFRPEVVACAADLTVAQAGDALDRLRDAGVLTDADQRATGTADEPRWCFRQDVVRRALYDALGLHRQRRLHHRIASAIEGLAADDRDDHVLDAARHRLAAGTVGSADADWVRRVVTRGRHAGGRPEARAVTAEALRSAPPGDRRRCELLALHGQLQLELGDRHAYATLIEAALTALRAGQLDVALDAAVHLSDAAAGDRSRRDEARALLTDVIAVATRARAGGGLGLARAAARLVRLGGRLMPGTAALAVCAIVRELGRREGVDALVQRRALAGELAALATSTGNGWGVAVAAHHTAMVAELSGAPPGTASAALATMAGSTVDRAVIDALLVEHEVAAHTTAGRFAEAVTATRDSPAHSPRTSVFGDLPPGSGVAVQLLVAGWLRRPRAWVLDAPWPAPGATPASRALAALRAGDPGRAALTVRTALAGLEPLPPGDVRLVELGLLSIVAVELGDETLAEEVWQLLLPFSDLVCCLGYRAYVGPASFHLGRLAVLLGAWGEAELHLSLALRHLASRRAHPWIAIAERDLGTALAARGRPHLVRATAAGRG